MSTDEQIHLLDDLQSLLEEQIKLTRQGNISGVEVLSRQADSLVKEIAQTRILELPGFEDQQQRLRRLYDSLCLAITARKSGIAEELSRLRRGRKTVEIYRNNI